LTFGFVPDEKLLKKYDPAANLDEYKTYIKGSLAGDGFHTEITGLSYIQGVSFKKPPYSLYDVNLTFKPCPNSEPIIIQIMPKKGGYSFMRFDMNPNRITKKGMENFWTIIEEVVLLIPGHSISREDFLIWSKIYIAEIAVDILGARPSELEITSMTNNKPIPQKSHVYKSKTGRVQTKYPKVKKGKSDTEYVYDKRQERLDCGAEPIYGDFLHSRFECRVQKTTFYKLSNIKNRCVRVSIRTLDYGKFSKMKYTQHLFIRYALDRTLDKALEAIPPKFKPTYQNAYDTAMRKIWDAKKIWSYWPETLKNSDLIKTTKAV